MAAQAGVTSGSAATAADAPATHAGAYVDSWYMQDLMYSSVLKTMITRKSQRGSVSSRSLLEASAGFKGNIDADVNTMAC